MPLSYQSITNPSSTSFTVSFEFLNLADIKAVGKLNSASTWTELPVTGAATTSNGVTTVTVADAGTYSSAGAIRIYRASTQDPLVDFQNGSRLSESDLDTAYRQGLFAAQEVRENAGENITTVGPQGAAGAAGADATIGVGSIDLDKLSATGTKDATTFLRGDNTFAAPAASVFGSEYFAANRTTDETHTNQTYGKIGINNELVDVGNNYDTTNCRYVAPITGFYFFYARGYFDAKTDGQLALVDFLFKKNGSDYVAETEIDFQNTNGRRGGTTLNATLSLSANDYIEWWAQVKDSSGNPKFISHSGAGVVGSSNQFGGWRIA